MIGWLRRLFWRLPSRVALGSGIGIDAARFYPGEVWHSEDTGVTWSRGPIRQGGTGKTRAVVTNVDRELGEITMAVLMSTDELKASP